jgi:hypothetical protein
MFTIPITSLSGFDQYVGASFLQYVTPILFKAGLNASEAQIGSAVVAAQVRLLGLQLVHLHSVVPG